MRPSSKRTKAVAAPLGQSAGRFLSRCLRRGCANHIVIRGWRLFFYSNERDEPPHVHARKGNTECKFWLHAERFDVADAYSFNLGPADRRVIRQIIFEHFDYILSEYQAFHEGRDR